MRDNVRKRLRHPFRTCTSGRDPEIIQRYCRHHYRVFIRRHSLPIRSIARIKASTPSPNTRPTSLFYPPTHLPRTQRNHEQEQYLSSIARQSRLLLPNKPRNHDLPSSHPSSRPHRPCPQPRPPNCLSHLTKQPRAEAAILPQIEACIAKTGAVPPVEEIRMRFEYEMCTFERHLRNKYDWNGEDIANWVCI